MGGMQSLEWAYFGEHYIRSIVVIACSAAQSAWAISWNEMQRSAIRADPNFSHGNYHATTPPTNGLAIARMAAMLTYRAHGSMQRRFGRRHQTRLARSCLPFEAVSTREDPLEQASNTNLGSTIDQDTACLHRRSDTVFAAQSYLEYQGRKFNSRFDANCYIALTEKLDTHDITRGRVEAVCSDRATAALKLISQPVMVIGIDGDVLYPLEEQFALAEGLPNAQFEYIVSDDGHDAFLLESVRINQIVTKFMTRTLPARLEKGDVLLSDSPGSAIGIRASMTA